MEAPVTSPMKIMYARTGSGSVNGQVFISGVNENLVYRTIEALNLLRDGWTYWAEPEK